MDPVDVLRVALRWGHSLAAAAWVGGSLFYLVVLRPALGSPPGQESLSLQSLVLQRFREVVVICMVVLVVTGVLLTFDRLSVGLPSERYVLLLGVKIVAAVAMFLLAQELAQRRLGRWASRVRADSAVTVPLGPEALGANPPREGPSHALSPSLLVLALGVLILLLTALLRIVYEYELRLGPG